MNEPQIDLSGTRILVVDDVPENLDVLLNTLEGQGYQVLVATNGEKALEVVAQAVPDLILLDVMMPVLDGFETCRRLKADENLAKIPVIFLTARDDLEGMVEGFDAGGVDYIVKPFNRREVLVRMQTHLERARYAQALAELNAHLEEKVEERTEQLHHKVRELEGRDRIARYMFTVHDLDEVLVLVLEVISDLVTLDQAMVLLLYADGELKPAAAIGAGGKVVEQLDTMKLDEVHQDAVGRVQQQRMSVLNVDEKVSFAIVPILRDTDLLGVIVVDRNESPISDDEIQTLERFAKEAAMAIHDAQIRRDPNAWDNQLDEILDLDEDVDTTALFDQFKDENK